MPRTYDVIVIGAGIIGTAVAFELGKRGYRTLNIDKLPAAGQGPTSNSCAIVRSHYSSADGVAMAHESYFYWRNWAEYLGVTDEHGTAEFRDAGVIVLKSETGQYLKSVQHFESLGVPYEDWDAAELARHMPMLELGSFFPPRRPDDPAFNAGPTERLEGAIFTPQAGYVNDPLLATHNLQRAAENQGAEFLFRAQVTAIRQSGGRVQGVRLQDGQVLDAPVIVNVAGPQSHIINQLAEVDAEMRVTTRPLRHEVHYVPAPPNFDFQDMTTSDGDLGIYFRPAGPAQLLVGSEDPECDDREWVADADNFSRVVTEKQWEAQVYRLARRIPSLGIPTKRRGVVDLYDVSDDWIPIYDASSLGGYYMAVGSSGNQFKTAPVAGVLMATLIEQVESGRDHDEHPVTLACKYTGLTLNGGFFSRRRSLVRGSSFSVMG